jgi:hypothetical protein
MMEYDRMLLRVIGFPMFFLGERLSFKAIAADKGSMFYR